MSQIYPSPIQIAQDDAFRCLVKEVTLKIAVTLDDAYNLLTVSSVCLFSCLWKPISVFHYIKNAFQYISNCDLSYCMFHKCICLCEQNSK